MGKVAVLSEYSSAKKSRAPAIEIQVSDVYALADEAYARDKSNARVKELADVLKRGEEFSDPIEVALCPGTGTRYILLDGRHSYFAAKAAGLNTLKAIINSSLHLPSSLPANLKSVDKKILTDVLYQSTRSNWAHCKMPLTPSEKRDSLKKLYKAGYSVEDLKAFVPNTTLYRWLGKDIKFLKEDTKKQCLEMVDKGAVQKTVSKEKGVSKQTVSRWKNERGKLEPLEKSQNSQVGKMGLPNPEGSTLSALSQTTPLTTIQRLESICEEIRQMQWNEEADAVALSYLLPLLQSKSERLSAVLKDGYLAGTISQQEHEIQRLGREFVRVTQLLSAERTEKDKLQQKLDVKARSCDVDCNYLSLEKRKVFDMLMGENVTDAIDHLTLTLSPQDEDLLTKLARKAVARIPSHLEWADLHLFLDKNDQKYIDSFESQLYKLEKEKGVKINGKVAPALKRVRESRKFFEVQ